jgi:RimJ/RimL family protein N-acetyltransferase
MSQEIQPQNFYNITTNSPSEALPTVILTSTTLPITLRTLLPSDTPALISILSNPANTEDDLSVSDLSEEKIKEIVDSWLIVSKPLSKRNFLILESGVPIGISGFGWIGWNKDGDESAGRAGSLGVVLNPEHRRKGYGYEALWISVDYGLRELGLVEVRVGTTSKNLGMRRLMEEKFRVKAEVTKPDRFGNDLEWKFGEDWLRRGHF